MEVIFSLDFVRVGFPNPSVQLPWLLLFSYLITAQAMADYEVIEIDQSQVGMRTTS